MSDLTFKTPGQLDELVACLREADASTYLLGGGTDLVIRMRDRGISQGTLIDLTGVAGLDAVEATGDFITIGANVTYAAISEHPLITSQVPCLAQMASQIGSLQIRNMARIPGNLANASPAGDSLATLMALGARAHLINGQGEVRVLPVHEIVVGIGKTVLNRDEAIIQIAIPQPGPCQRSRYGKIGLGARSQVVIANVSLTMVLEFTADLARIDQARVVLGSAAPVAYHATEAEALLRGRKPDAGLAEELAAVLEKQVEASIKGIAMFQHKRNDIQGLALDMCAHLFRDAR
jgi:CO/xanthine dehydrogenase FAD-binding subunit